MLFHAMLPGGRVSLITARAHCRLASSLFPMVAALLVRGSLAPWGVILAFILVLGPVAAVGQSLPAARKATATNAVASKPVNAVAHAKIWRWKPMFRSVEMSEGSSEAPAAAAIPRAAG